jgi:hypothetical protein
MDLLATQAVLVAAALVVEILYPVLAALEHQGKAMLVDQARLHLIMLVVVAAALVQLAVVEVVQPMALVELV